MPMEELHIVDAQRWGQPDGQALSGDPIELGEGLDAQRHSARVE